MEKYLKRYKNECNRLLSTSYATFSMNNNIKHDVIKNCNLEVLHTDCSAILSVLLYGKGNISSEEVTFPLAFALKIHRSGNQAFRLLRLIYRVHNIYCVHVDKKASPDLYNQFKTISSCVENIIVIQDRVNVVYSNIRQVEAEFRCMDVVRNS